MRKFYKDAKINKWANEMSELMPKLGDFFAKEDSLNQYSQGIYNYNATNKHQERQKKFLELISQKIETIFSTEELKKISYSFGNGLVSGIVDHHSVMDHPILLSTNFVANYHKIFSKKDFGDIVTFATGNVPCSESFNKGGLTINGKHINLYPKKHKKRTMYGAPKLNIDIVSKLQRTKEWNKFSLDEQKTIENLNNIIQKIDFSTCEYLSDQITKINFYMRRELFQNSNDNNICNLISLEYDDIVSKFMVHVFKNDPDSFISKMIFNSKFQDIVLKSFDGIVGARDLKRSIGTHFFWWYTEDGKRVRLKLSEDRATLIGINHDIQIPLTIEAIERYVDKKQLIPGMMLKFALIMIYMGMKPIAAFSIQYLDLIQSTLLPLLEQDFPNEPAIASPIPLDNSSALPIIMKQNTLGEIVQAYPLEIMKQGGYSKEYFKKLNAIPFNKLYASAIGFGYGYSRDKYGHDKQLPEDTFDATYLKKYLENVWKDIFN